MLCVIEVLFIDFYNIKCINRKFRVKISLNFVYMIFKCNFDREFKVREVIFCIFERLVKKNCKKL